VLLVLSYGLKAFAANVEILTFDDLPTPATYGSPVPAGYGDFQWNNFNYLDGADFIASGYQNGVVSASNVAFNGAGNPALFSSSGMFDLDSGWLTAAWNDGLSLEVLGFVGNTVVYDNTYVLDATAPTMVNFNYLQVDSVEFISSGGVNHGYDGSGAQFVMDDLTVTVPEPTAYALLSVGAMLGGFGVRRRQGPIHQSILK
jgi:PEP-CTERM motif